VVTVGGAFMAEVVSVAPDEVPFATSLAADRVYSPDFPPPPEPPQPADARRTSIPTTIKASARTRMRFLGPSQFHPQVESRTSDSVNSFRCYRSPRHVSTAARKPFSVL